MFELSFITKYLRPRLKQLSVSIVSLISILVITLVVWLILVFLSVTNGMEKKWTDKLIALSAPLQVSPTQDYYDSDYYQVDGICFQSDYTYKTIEEKQNADLLYDANLDEEPSASWVASGGKDLVKEAFDGIKSVKQITNVEANDYEVSVANARLRLLRSSNSCNLGFSANHQSFLNQIAYLSSFDPQHLKLKKSIIKPSEKDLSNILSLLASSSDSIQHDQPNRDQILAYETFQKRLKNFLTKVDINQLKVSEYGYTFNPSLLPQKGRLKAVRINNSLHIPQNSSEISNLKKGYQQLGLDAEVAFIDLSQSAVIVQNKKYTLDQFELTLCPDISLPAKLVTTSIKQAKNPTQLKFYIDASIQSVPIKGDVLFNNLELGSSQIKSDFDNLQKDAFWLYSAKVNDKESLILPNDPLVGDGVLLPKSYQESGVLLGDRGYLSYHTQTTSAMQEMRLPIFVVGFYDPGLIPNGGKIILAPKKMIASINAAINVKDSLVGNGINVRFDDIKKADQVKAYLEQEFKRRGISKFWEIKTYKEYDFSKDFLEQVSSDKTIFSLISVIIIVVACTNIISMLILLVSNKKKEIGILEAMGATKKSIALIFGGCGLLIGLLSSVLGTVAAYFTLKHIGALMNFISKLQGHQAFNPAFFGDTLPTSINSEAFNFVIIATVIMSLLAGFIPAVKAMKLNTTDILKSEN